MFHMVIAQQVAVTAFTLLPKMIRCAGPRLPDEIVGGRQPG